MSLLNSLLGEKKAPLPQNRILPPAVDRRTPLSTLVLYWTAQPLSSLAALA